MQYEFKLIPEAVRAGGIALLVFVVTLLVDFDVDEVVSDWQTYVKSLASGGVAAAAAAILAVLTRPRSTS